MSISSLPIELSPLHASELNTLQAPTNLCPFRAAHCGDQAVLGALLRTGQVTADTENECGETLLSRAVQGEHKEIVEMLLKTSPTKMDQTDCRGLAPLSLAALEGMEDIVELLLATQRVDVNVTDDSGGTPLHLAAGGDHTRIVELLLQTGLADIHTRTANNETIMSIAAEAGAESVVELILKEGFKDINVQQGWMATTALMEAVVQGHEGIVKRFLQIENIDLDIYNRDFHTALDIALLRGEKAMARMIRRKRKLGRSPHPG
ncbi:hypothetical protein N7456_011104 [Penicillium angulare]|uniref:Ankyrin n=1 Tax=Penicillium angulare TaxID=116970 RepID=A0A9W9ET59_9EURO|nr:hypothetical protein N7456_011104 [Penicillium angulare]